MKNHTKVYFKAFGYDVSDWIPCEVCRATAVDIHHIDSRGLLGAGGTFKADVPSNLMAVCRECHIKYGDKKQYKTFLKMRHEEFMKTNLKR